MQLEKKSLKLAGSLLSLCLESASEKIKEEAKKFETPEKWAEDILTTGVAHKKMMEIIDAQKGDATITSDKLKPGSKTKEVKSDKSGVVKKVNNRNVSLIAKILGAPTDAKAGLFLRKRVDDEVKNGEVMFDMYAQKENNLEEAIDTFRNFPIYEIE